VTRKTREKKNSDSYHKFEQEQSTLIYDELVSLQSPKKAVFGAFLGAFIGLIFFVLCALNGILFIWMLFLPSFLVGYFACSFGKLYQLKYTFIPAIIASLLHTFAIVFLFQFNFMSVFSIPVSFLITVYFSKIRLTEVQAKALWRKEQGKF
jgi:hypothetical protein